MHVHAYFICRHCWHVITDDGNGFSTPMLCSECDGCTWIFVSRHASNFKALPREVQESVVLYAACAASIRTVNQRI